MRLEDTLELEEEEEESELVDEVLDRFRLLNCRLTAAYNSSAGKACVSFGSMSLDVSNPKPNSKQAVSSLISSSVMSELSEEASRLLLRRKRRRCWAFNLFHSVLRWISGDNERFLYRIGQYFFESAMSNTVCDGGGISGGD